MRKKKLSDDDFEKLFGFRPRQPPGRSKKEKTRIKEINKLFDLVRSKCGLSEAAIFEAIGERPALGAFLKDVSTCPEKVLEYCRAAIAPGSTLLRP